MKKTQESKEVRTVEVFELNAQDILKLFKQKGNGRTKVQFHVPGGGDWSNCDIEIDDEHPITVTFEEIN